MSFFPVVTPSLITRVTLNGTTIFDFQFSPDTAYAGLKVDADGKVYKRLNFGAWTQIYPATDWVRPVSMAPGLYEVRYTNRTGAALDSATKPEDTWHSLSAGDFILTQERDSHGWDETDLTVEIRLDGGPVLASAAYTLKAQYEDTGL